VEVWQTSNLRRLRLGEEKKKKKEEEEERTNHSMKIYMVSLLHRATIKNYCDPTTIVEIIVGGWVVSFFLRHSVVSWVLLKEILYTWIMDESNFIWLYKSIGPSTSGIHKFRVVSL